MELRDRIMVAPNGARRTKADHPALPLTVAELAETAHACSLAGAGAIHLHVRDDDGRHSLDPVRYRDAIDVVSEAAPDLKIQITTESANRYDVADQFACLTHLRPDWASVSVREIARAMELARHIYASCAEMGTRVQHILYSPDCVTRLSEWMRNGTVLPEQREAIFVLGQYTPSVVAQPSDLDCMLHSSSALDLDWTVCAFGRFERTCLSYAYRCGGKLRIGFENNIETPQGVPLESNAASVAALIHTLSDQVIAAE